MFCQLYGESERKLREVFEQAASASPAVIVIDELDSIAPARGGRHGELENRLVAALCTLLDGVGPQSKVVVIGTTNRLNAIDNALRRPGRFEHEIGVGVPDARGRLDILKIHTRHMPLAADVDLRPVATRAVGFVGADIVALCREAAYGALRRAMEGEEPSAVATVRAEELAVNADDFESALKAVRPSALREFAVEMPATTWEDVGGLDKVRQLLTESVTYPFTRPEAFAAAGVRAPRGVLLYGPPGTGKTLLARAVACECGANFIAVSGPEVRGMWFGESEERVRALFARARQVAPCVLFFDELDAIAAGRDPHRSTTAMAAESIVNQILAEMDGIGTSDGVIVLAATNRPKILDGALLRPGRFDFQVEVPLPDEAAREAVFGIHLRPIPVADDLDVHRLAVESDGLSGADIAGVCREAAMEALRESGFEHSGLSVSMAHLVRTLQQCRTNQHKLGTGRIGFRATEK